MNPQAAEGGNAVPAAGAAIAPEDVR